MSANKYNQSKHPVKTKRPPKGDFMKRINQNMKRLTHSIIKSGRKK